MNQMQPNQNLSFEALLSLAQNIPQQQQNVPQQNMPQPFDNNLALLASLMQNPQQSQQNVQQPQLNQQLPLVGNPQQALQQQPPMNSEQLPMIGQEFLQSLVQGHNQQPNAQSRQPGQLLPQQIPNVQIPFAQLQQLIGALTQFQNIIAISQISQSLLGGQLPQQQQVKEEPSFCKYFVGGILYSAKESDIEKYFSQYGHVVDVAIMRDKNSGKSRGFAFVTFKENSKDAVKQLSQRLINPPSPHIIQNRMIEVREGDGSKPPDSFLDKQSRQPQEKSKSRAPNSSFSSKSHNDSDRNQQSNSQSNRGQTSNLDQKRRNRDGEQSSVRDKVFVGGLDYNLSDEDFKKHFEQFGSIKEAQIVRDQMTGASKGFGFVTYHKDSIAKKLIQEIKSTNIQGRKVDLRNAEPKLSEKITTINKSVQEDGSKRTDRDQNRDQNGKPELKDNGSKYKENGNQNNRNNDYRGKDKNDNLDKERERKRDRKFDDKRDEKIERQNDRVDKPERIERIERTDRPERSDRVERPERNDKIPEKIERPERSERSDRNERSERPERNERGDRDRNERNDRSERPERTERTDRNERSDRNDRDRNDRGERNDRNDRGDRNDRNDRNSDRNNRGNDRNERGQDRQERVKDFTRQSSNQYKSQQ